MKLTRILSHTVETYNSENESTRTHTYRIDGEEVDLETFSRAENQRCLYSSEKHWYEPMAHVMPEGRVGASGEIIKQYFPF